jgi:Spy/CpxP family protein refolding chaperone
MRKLRLGVIVASALLAALVVVPVDGWAQGGDGQGRQERQMQGRRGGGGPGPAGLVRMLERNAAQLGIDAATLERARGIETAAQERSGKLSERQRAEREAMRKLLDADAPDEAAVLAQADVMGQLDTDLRKQELRSMLEIRRLLTPEQRSAVAKLRDERPRGQRGRRGRGGRGPAD